MGLADINIKQWYRHKYHKGLAEVTREVALAYLRDEILEEFKDPVAARKHRENLTKVVDELNERGFDIREREYHVIESYCPECGARMIIKNMGERKKLICPKGCGAVLTHPGTDIPLGKIADRETRIARIKAHEAFDKMWLKMCWSRSYAYEWLAKQMGLTQEECHIAMLTKDQCDRVIELAEEQRVWYEKPCASDQ